MQDSWSEEAVNAPMNIKLLNASRKMDLDQLIHIYVQRIWYCVKNDICLIFLNSYVTQYMICIVDKAQRYVLLIPTHVPPFSL